MSCNSALALGLSQEDVPALVESWNFTTDDGGHLFRTNRCGQPGMLTKINVRGVKRQVSVRHTLWEMKYGRIAQGKRLVGCPDNPKCVNPEHQTLLRKQDPKERFMRFVEKQPGEGGCWLWVGHTRTRNNGAPYGYFTAKRGADEPAYHFAYKAFVGPIPRDKEVDHICHCTTCVRPSHLRLVSRTGNAQNLLPTSKRSAFGFRNLSFVEKRKSKTCGSNRIGVEVKAFGKRHLWPRKFFLVELPHAEQIARYMRRNYQTEAINPMLAAISAGQGVLGDTRQSALTDSVKALHDLYAAPLVRTTPTKEECKRLLTRWRKLPLTDRRFGAYKPVNNFHPEADPLCLYYEVSEDETTERKFLRLVSKTAGTKGCWVWQGLSYVDARGNPGIEFRDKNGNRMPAQQFAYRLFRGPVENGGRVGHTCGNYLCVNPHHLFLYNGRAPKR